jgi:tRNA (guanine10-N2)-dimethyltransferase
MVNLAAVPMGGRIMDPMCGTGGILIEAGLLGYQVYGSDKDPRMVSGSRENLEAFGIDAVLDVADVTEASSGTHHPPEAIVTDPPYGRSTSLFGRLAEGVLDGLYRMAASRLPHEGRLVLCLPDLEMLPPEGSGFRLTYHHPMKVHRSLTRHVCLLVRDFH